LFELFQAFRELFDTDFVPQALVSLVEDEGLGDDTALHYDVVHLLQVDQRLRV